jgi:thiol:disulfide interchange protein DsbA
MLSLARLLLVLTAILPFAFTTAADAPAFEAGKEFKPLPAPQPTSDPSKIEVMEVFAYSCPHCFAFDPLLKAWVAKLPKDVKFVRLPHTLGHDENVVRNHAFYAAQMLGVEDKFHAALFKAVHEDHKPMASQEELRDLFAKELGVPASDFDSAYSSFAVDGGFRRGEGIIRDMAIGSVPTLVVDGRNYTSPSQGGGFPQMLQVADYLIAQARASRPKSAKADAAATPAAQPKKKKAKAPAAPKTP